MGINTEDIGDMILSIKDNKAQHNKDLNQWITDALYRYTTGDIKLHEVELLSRINDLNIQDKDERIRMFTVIENARAWGYLD
jgi:hypothetical protein